MRLWGYLRSCVQFLQVVPGFSPTTIEPGRLTHTCCENGTSANFTCLAPSPAVRSSIILDAASRMDRYFTRPPPMGSPFIEPE